MGKLSVRTAVATAMALIAGCGVGGSSSSVPNGLEATNAGGGGAGGRQSASSGTGGAGGGVGILPDAPPGPVKLNDAQILAIKKTANQGEIDQANAALTCAQNPKVVAFAKEMIADHSAALTKVDALIAKLGSADSPENAALMNVGKQYVKVIETDNQSGPCDQEYMKTQIAAHSTVLALIDEVLEPSAQAPEVQAEVRMEKPVVQMHLDMANTIAVELGVDVSKVEGATKRCDSAELTEGQVVKWLLVSNQSEVDDGQKVLSKAVIPEARAFAQRMIGDHGAALVRLQALISRLGITPEPSQESKDKMVEGDVSNEVLDMLEPPMFDLTYVDLEVLDHVEDLDTIDEKLLPSTCTPDLKAEVSAERAVVAKHQGISHAIEPTVRAEANP